MAEEMIIGAHSAAFEVTNDAIGSSMRLFEKRWKVCTRDGRADAHVGGIRLIWRQTMTLRGHGKNVFFLEPMGRYIPAKMEQMVTCALLVEEQKTCLIIRCHEMWHHNVELKRGVVAIGRGHRCFELKKGQNGRTGQSRQGRVCTPFPTTGALVPRPWANCDEF